MPEPSAPPAPEPVIGGEGGPSLSSTGTDAYGARAGMLEVDAEAVVVGLGLKCALSESCVRRSRWSPRESDDRAEERIGAAAMRRCMGAANAVDDEDACIVVVLLNELDNDRVSDEKDCPKWVGDPRVGRAPLGDACEREVDSAGSADDEPVVERTRGSCVRGPACAGESEEKPREG